MSTEPTEPIAFHPHPPAEVTRRRALGVMAASLALATGACTRPPREKIYPWVDMPELHSAGVHVYYASAFVRDGYAHGVRVGTFDGRPIKIEGNPLHPASLGRTDAFTQASVLQLWDPDRSPNVVAHGTAASWEQFETAWRAQDAQLLARRGEGLHLLTGPVTSPTLRAQLARLLERYPAARWHQHSALRDFSAQAGAVAAFGRPVDTVLRFDRADCAVALGCDPFSEGPGAVRHAADWSRRRSSTTLFAVEATPGLFGARAQRRIALAPAQLDAMVQRLASNQPAPGFEQELLRAIEASGPATLIVPGACLSAASHAAVHALHERLGATGHTVEPIEPLAYAPQAGTLADLVTAMKSGAVQSLIVLDANPVYDAPGAMEFRAALANVPLTIHAGLHRDETARACTWHLPLSHVYEQWSDALACDGTACIVQPAIAPLYDSRSAHELLALLASDDVRDGHALVQRTWRDHGGSAFDAFWRDSLRRGAIEGTAAAPLKIAANKATPPVATPAPAGLVALFAPDPSTHDGSFSNNSWLQELPRPFTKMTWDNALLVGRATAQRIGVRSGDIVQAKAAGRSVQAPVWVIDAQAEGVVTLPLGYGRTAAGRVGNGVGFDAYALRAADSGMVTPVEITKAAAQHDFAVTQHAMDQEGRKLARTVAPGGSISDPQFAHETLYPHHPSPEHAWGMTIDLDACIGCNACTIACQAENNIPVVGKEQVAHGREMHWIRVDRYETGEVDGSLFQPVPCMHCENAPCELVCPVGATMHDSEGLNVQVYNRCIGTRFCSNNCPYKVRRFNFLQFTDNETETLKAQRNPEVTVRRRGVMEKCTYCLQRIARARQESQTTGVPLRDGDVVTACQAVCPTSAISFGDLNDPASAVVRARQTPRHYALLGELNTRPRTTYLARVVPRKPEGA